MAVLKRAAQSARYLLRLVASRMVDDRCVEVAGDLTFTTLLALVPLFTIALTLLAAFPMFDDWSNAFKVFLLTTLVPEVSGKVITVYMQQFADNAARLTAIGLVFLALTALMLMASIERVFNAIWRARRPRSAAQRVVVYWATLTIGPLLIGASLSITSWLVTQSLSLAGDGSGARDFLLRLLPVLLNAAAFALVYLVIPNRRVLARDALVGGATAAVAFELMKRGFALYVALFPTYDLVYGAFATLPIFLLWIYLSWIVVLFGAVAAAVLPRWRLGAQFVPAQGEEAFFRALRLIDALYQEQGRAGTPSAPRLMALTGLAEDDVDDLLGRMETAGWVRRVEPSGWMLARDLQGLRVAELYRLFVLRAGAPAGAGGPLLLAAERLLVRLEAELDVPLQALLDAGAGGVTSRSPSEQGETRAAPGSAP